MIVVTHRSIGSYYAVDGRHIKREPGRLYEGVIEGFEGANNIKLKVSCEVKGFDGKPIKQTWTAIVGIDKLKWPLSKGEA
jgi:hypothetical protein